MEPYRTPSHFFTWKWTRIWSFQVFSRLFKLQFFPEKLRLNSWISFSKEPLSNKISSSYKKSPPFPAHNSVLSHSCPNLLFHSFCHRKVLRTLYKKNCTIGSFFLKKHHNIFLLHLQVELCSDRSTVVQKTSLSIVAEITLFQNFWEFLSRAFRTCWTREFLVFCRIQSFWLQNCILFWNFHPILNLPITAPSLN